MLLCGNKYTLFISKYGNIAQVLGWNKRGLPLKPLFLYISGEQMLDTAYGRAE